MIFTDSSALKLYLKNSEEAHTEGIQRRGQSTHSIASAEFFIYVIYSSININFWNIHNSFITDRQSSVSIRHTNNITFIWIYDGILWLWVKTDFKCFVKKEAKRKKYLNIKVMAKNRLLCYKLNFWYNARILCSL